MPVRNAKARKPSVSIAFYCPRVQGTVEVKDCAYCRCFQEDLYQDVNECRSENLVAGYQCTVCRSFMPPGALLDGRGNLVCAHCVMNGATASRKLETIS